MKKLLPMLLFFLVPAVSFGQGSRLDDVAFKNLVTGIAPAAGATVTVCTSAGTGIPCTPTTTVYSDIALTIPLANPLTADSNGYYGFYAAPGRYIVTVTGAGTSGKSITYILPCDPSGAASASCLTLAANNTFTGTDTFTGRVTLSGGIGANTFKGPSPWVDVTDPQYGAKCDGSTDDTTAIQNALNAVAQKGDGTGTYNGGTVFIPPGKTGACVVSTLNMDGMINVTVMSPGFTVGNPNANSVPSIKFTGTCITGPCLSMKSTNGITFSGIGLFFSGATTGPMIDLGHCTVSCHGQTSDSAYIAFHSVSFDGPGGLPPTVGPLISIPQGEFINFDGWSVFQGATIYVKGSPDNTMVTDLVSFNQVYFANPATAAVQNAGVAWSFTGIDYTSGQGVTTNCIPFLAYTATNIIMQNLTISSSEFNLGPTNCTNVFTMIGTPNGGTNLGGVSLMGNLFLAPTGATNATAISLGNTQALFSAGNVFQNFLTVYAVGTADSVAIGPNIYTGITNFRTGTPQNGTVLDNSGQTTFYSGSNTPLSVLNASVTVGGAFLPSAAGNPDIGSTALPFGNLWLGTAATNNFKFQPAVTAASRIISMPDPGGAANLAFVNSLAINNIPKMNSASTSLFAASLETDSGTQMNYTGTGGYLSNPASVAGSFSMKQGTTTSTGTTAVSLQAPTAVTSYIATLPGAAPVNSQSAMVFSNAAPSVGAFAKMQQTAITSGTAYTNATTTFSNVVGGSGQTLQFSVEANTNYVLACNILWQASVNTAGPKWQFTGPASPTAVQYAVTQAVTATTDGTAGATAFSTSLNASGAAVVVTTNEPAELSLGLVNGPNAGTIVLQAAAQGVGTLTIQPGSYCTMQ